MACTKPLADDRPKDASFIGIQSRAWILERSARRLREADLNVFSKLGKQGLE
jgi:hypothetical protein